MFWSKGRKKTEEAVLEEVRDSLGPWRGLLEQMRQGQTEEAGKLAAVLEENRQAAQEEAKVLRRQSESVEDLLDFMQEEAEKKSALEEQLQESREREEALLALACCAREQLELVTQRLMEDASWREQCRMLEQEAEKYLRDADMRETERPANRWIMSCIRFWTRWIRTKKSWRGRWPGFTAEEESTGAR